MSHLSTLWLHPAASVQVRDKMGPQSAQVDVRVALRPRRWYSLAITHAMGRSAISQARPWLSQVRLSRSVA